MGDGRPERSDGGEAADRFVGILRDPFGSEPGPASEDPEVLADLHLDRLLDAVATTFPEHDLAPLFATPLRDEDAIRYRQEVFRDLWDPGNLEPLRAFARGMDTVRARLAVAAESRYPHERQRWFLDAALAYRDTVTELARDVLRLDLTSRALRGFRDRLLAHVRGEPFAGFATEAGAAAAGLEAVRSVVTIKGTHVTVGPDRGEPAFTEQVTSAFAKFRQGDAKDYRARIVPGAGMNHVHARIVDLIARQHPEPFAALDRFVARHRGFRGPLIRRFDREIRFYLAYLAYIEPLRAVGLPFCFPAVSTTSKETSVVGAFDLILARKLVEEGRAVVGNGLRLEGRERLLVVTGPNQGGKTTFARMVGQLHHLARLGCPVPGTAARLFAPDRIFTHFEREEDVGSLRGKLEDELLRIRAILDRATGDSLVILNETFSSTTLDDARALGMEVIRRLTDLDALGVYVTFVDELAAAGPSTVSMVAAVDPADPTVRTFEIHRRPADGLAYAQAIAHRYGLSRSALRERLGS